MKFIGLKPRFDNYKLPDFLKSSVGLFRAFDNKPLPCLINSITITKENTIPSEPVDSNVHVSDNIIIKPLLVSLELYIYEQDSVDFNNLVKSAQHDKEGFLFVNRDGAVYNDLYVESITDSFTNEKLGGFDCMMELRQVIKVEALQSLAALLPKQALTKDQGTVAVNKAPPEVKERLQSNLYKTFYGG